MNKFRLLQSRSSVLSIALVGYGKMGKQLDVCAQERGHKIVGIIRTQTPAAQREHILSEAQIALEFTTPQAAFPNVMDCLRMGVKVVCGTTGWHKHINEAERFCLQKNSALLVASNCSIGVNVFFALNEWMATQMKTRKQYAVSIAETHHIHKKDSPSGTALSLRAGITSVLPAREIPIVAKREGEVIGEHTVSYDSPFERISLCHRAKDRKVFAEGAMDAAEFIHDKTGVFSMRDLLGI